MSGFWRFFRYGLLTIAALVAILITMPFIWAGSAEVYQWLIRYTHHYRLVLEVEDHGEIRTGSSVIGVSFSPLAPWIHSEFGSSKTRIRGEAVVVELSTGQVVVATLRHGIGGRPYSMSGLASLAFPDLSKEARDKYKYWMAGAPHWDAVIDLPDNLIPMLILFEDTNNPLYFHEMRHDDLTEMLGPEIRFLRVRLEMTSDAVTSSIKDHLPFLREDWSGADSALPRNHDRAPPRRYFRQGLYQ